MDHELRYRLKMNEDGTWAVFDTEMDAPAQIVNNAGETSATLDELSESEARAWWRLLNKMLGTVLH